MFSKMKKEFQAHVETMIAEQSHLFVTSADPDKLWELYLKGK